MAAGVGTAKTSLPRRRWLAFLDCAAADEEPTGANTPLALNEDVESEVHILIAAADFYFFYRMIVCPMAPRQLYRTLLYDLCCPAGGILLLHLSCTFLATYVNTYMTLVCWLSIT